ncbi:MAG: NAD(P)/FAD-dependent oxidoreductase, partial [Clostridia bacterium]|nr:NAD(P)/FAD-dependent oxidoreductase [Clostridia bacterium]
MNKIYKTAIIGGGASGVACAVELLSDSDGVSCRDFVLLEGNDRLLKKLSASGN